MSRNEAEVYSLFADRKFNTLFPNVQVLYEEDFFLICDSWEYMIPKVVKENQELNIFEYTVIRLLRVHPLTDDELSEKMCVAEDFVRFVIVGLIERGYLKESREISKKSEELFTINSDINLENKNEYELGRALALRGEKNILPIIIASDSEDLYLGETEDGRIRFNAGTTTGKSREISRRYWAGRKQDKSFKPNARMLKKAVSTYLKNKYEKINKNMVNIKDFNKKGSVFLHLKAVIQEGYTKDFIISDGLNANNDIIKKYIKELIPNYYEKLIERATMLDLREVPNVEDKSVKRYCKYSEIHKTLDNINILRGNNIDDMEVAEDKNMRSMRELFSALEWTLEYYLINNPIKDSYLDALRSQDRNERVNYVIECVKFTGCNIKDLDLKLFSLMDNSKLNAYRNRSSRYFPNLDILLPLCFVKAKYSQEEKFLKLVKKMPDILKFIGKLRYYAKNFRHSDNISWNQENITTLKEKIITIVKFLLPDYEKNGVIDDNTIIIENTSQSNVNSIRSVMDKLGWMVYNALPENVQKNLLKIAPINDSENRLSPNEFILTLSKIMENLLRSENEEMELDKERNLNAVIGYLENKLGRELPVGLKHVSNGYFNSALNGEVATLGAYALVWARNIDQETFDSEEIFHLLALVQEIAGLRSHGNNVNLEVDVNKLKDLRQQVFKFIIKLKE